jgi:molybdenum cofactor synthesis domain-containing protein
VADLDLFDKTELWLVGVKLNDVVLPDLAAATADALSLPRAAVFVTDVRDGHVVFDIVVPKVRLEDVIGREPEILAAARATPGVELDADAHVHSHGVLGIVGAPKDQAAGMVEAARALEANLRAYVSRRVAVVSTGHELIGGEIQDTNLAAIREQFGAAGYEVFAGGVAADTDQAIAGLVARLAEDGFGLIITTGGVGAEDKDRTIEALERLDPDIATAILASYEAGHGRHVKPHVRVACGRLGETLLVALPGPTREVTAALPALMAALAKGAGPAEIAEAVAAPIRALWRHAPAHGHHHHGNTPR